MIGWRGTAPLGSAPGNLSRRCLALAAGFVLAVLFLSGCAKMNATRSQPFTDFPGYGALVADRGEKITIAVDPFDVSSTEIKGGHHEGLLQVRQPWIWGLSEEQKQVLYHDLPSVVRYAFIDELLKRKQRVVVFSGNAPGSAADYMVTGAVKSVELNTYGQGTREGFGSAGNYWEAKIVMSDVAIVRTAGHATLWKGDITEYCKLEGSPAKLNWTIFTVISKSLQEGLALSRGVTPGGLKEAVETSAADYTIDPVMRNPVDIAARLAALDVLKLIFSPGTRNTSHIMPR
jgi:hypothetical protein